MLQNCFVLRFFILALSFFLGASLSYGQSDLILTAVFDGPLSIGVPKGVEIYVINDIPDLSIYGLGSANDGGGTDGEEFTFPSIAATAGEYLYVASESTSFSFFFGFAPNDVRPAVSINGDDAIELFQNGSVVDVFGTIDCDPNAGSSPCPEWEYSDGWAYRNNHTGPDGNTFILGNWSFSGINALDGETSNGSATYPVPIETFQYATTCVLPSSAATNLNITGVASTSANLTWTSGDGEARIVVVKQGSVVDVSPMDNATYLANSTFTLGEEIGSENHVVYHGTGNSVSLTGLTPGQIYYAKVFEYGCSPGQELYLTSIAPASAIFLAKPENPNLTLGCETTSEIDLSWSNPAAGTWDGYVVIGSQNASPTTVNSTSPAVLPVANSNFTAAPAIDVNKLLYQGMGNSLTVQGITPNQNYTFKIFSYRECLSCANGWEYSSGAQVSGNASLADVSSLSATPGLTDVQLSWNFNLLCADEIIVVASDNSVSGAPSGGGYAVNSNSFTDPLNPVLNPGEVIVYSSNGFFTSVINLTTETDYCFKVFVRKGSEWSSGIQVCETPTTTTTLEVGDIAILAVNTNIVGIDEISFVCFKTILPGTTVDFTDNGFQKCGTPNGWGISEGWIRLTRINTPLNAGEVVTIKNDNGAVTILAPDNNWVTSEPQPPLQGSFSLDNNGEQLFILSGGNITGPNASTAASDDGLYVGGKILFGFNTKGDVWTPVCGNSAAGGSANSDKPENFECYLSFAATNDDRNKYTGPFTFATVREWFKRINEPSNWTNYLDNPLYLNGEDYVHFNGTSLGRTLPIEGTISTPGVWLGDDNAVWFNCRNWETLKVPDQSVDVLISDEPTDPIISSAGAVCAKLTLETASSLTLGNSGSSLEILGDIILDGSINSSAGSISFTGTGNQLIGPTAPTAPSTIFANNLSIDKPPNTRVISNESISVSGEVDLVRGILDFKLGSGRLELDDGAGIVGGSTTSYVSGPLRKTGFTLNQEFEFPVGDYRVITVDSTVNVYQPAGIIPDGTSSTAIFDVEYFHENYTPGYTNPNNPPPGVIEASTCNYWLIDRSGLSPVDARVKLYYNNQSCITIEEAEKLRVARHNTIEWDNAGGFDINPSMGMATSGYVTSDVIGLFSPFTFASDGPGSNVLPITLLSFSAEAREGSVLCNWVTAAEINNDYFTIERSKDGNYWEKVGTIYGAGDSHTELSYSFTDERPYLGISYYRLRQTDYNGTSTISEPLAVEIRANGEFGIDQIFRDQQGLNVIYRSTAPYVVIEIYDLLGKRIHGELLENSGNSFGTIDPDLARGVYVLRLSDGAEMDSEKFVW